MLPILLALLAPEARAEAVIEFKTSGPVPVQIFVDGRQATLTGNLRQRVAGLEPGVHELRVSGMFGKTLYEAEIDLPDDTITTAAWEHGQIKVLSTDWLEREEDAVAAVEAEAPADSAVAEPAVGSAEAEVPAAPAPTVAEAVPEAPLAVPAGPPIEQPPVTPVAVAPPVAEAVALPSLAAPRTLTISASDGMRIEVVHEGRKVTVVVEGDAFRIEDPSGLSLALGAE